MKQKIEYEFDDEQIKVVGVLIRDKIRGIKLIPLEDEQEES